MVYGVRGSTMVEGLESLCWSRNLTPSRHEWITTNKCFALKRGGSKQIFQDFNHRLKDRVEAEREEKQRAYLDIQRRPLVSLPLYFSIE